jgi:hypothetical protein
MFRKLSAIALVSFLVFAGQANALDFTQPIKDLNGNDFTDQTGKPIPTTLGEIVESALRNVPAQAQDEKDKNFFLMLSVHNQAKDFTPTPDQIIRIRQAMVVTQPTAVYGQAMSLIDPTYRPKENK